MKIRILVAGFLTLILTACLVTRDQVRENVKGEPLTPEQQQGSNNEVRYQELEQQMREMNGRIETVENSVSVLNSAKSGAAADQKEKNKALEEKLKIYEESISKLEGQMLSLSQRVDSLQAAQTVPAKETKASADKTPFDTAENNFDKKKYKEAIVSYEKYRTKSPDGKHYLEATYKIGLSFHELGMKAEAKAFYSEVVEKSPTSPWAKKAEKRLKSLK